MAAAAVSAALDGVAVELTGAALTLLVGIAGATADAAEPGGAALVRFGAVTRFDVDDRTGAAGAAGAAGREAATVDRLGLTGVGVGVFTGVVDFTAVGVFAGAVVFGTGTGLAPRALHETVAPLAFTQCVATNAPAGDTNTVRPASVAKASSATSLTRLTDRR